MSINVLDVLKERGFLKQVVYEEDLYEQLGRKEGVTFYVGFDPTADSLHVGHFLVLMAMSHMQKAGHRPVVLLGAGTAMVGDPSGRTDMRSIMTQQTIEHNALRFKEQMSQFFSFTGPNAAIIENNADWLLQLNYVNFLREIGMHFSVNRMLTADCFKSRMEKGLSFLEFNYMLMQAYDFLVLFNKHNCILQCGGDDQWSNILAGADLIRRKEQKPAYAMTFSLLLTSDGNKMGKTQKGALWLDAEKTSPYEFFQYFRNVDDNDVKNCLYLLTFLPKPKIEEMTNCFEERDGIKYFSKDINKAKEVLAYEVTKIVHGEKEADMALAMSIGAFSDGKFMPSITLSWNCCEDIVDVIVESGFSSSKSEAKRLIQGRGIKVDKLLVENFDFKITDELKISGFILHKGKKNKIKVIFE